MGGVKKPEQIDFENLRGFEKAAILVNYLGEKATRSLFSDLEDTDIRKLLGVMNRLRVIPVSVTKKVLEEYYGMVSEADDYIFSNDMTTKDKIIEALGEERARTILGHLNIRGGSRNLESLDLVDA